MKKILIIIFCLLLVSPVYSASYFDITTTINPGNLALAGNAAFSLVAWVKDREANNITGIVYSDDLNNAPVGAERSIGFNGTSAARKFAYNIESGTCINLTSSAFAQTDKYVGIFAYSSSGSSGVYAFDQQGNILGSATGGGCASVNVPVCSTIGELTPDGNSCGTHILQWKGVITNLMVFNKVISVKEAKAILFAPDPIQFFNAKTNPVLWMPLTSATDLRKLNNKQLGKVNQGTLKNDEGNPVQPGIH